MGYQKGKPIIFKYEYDFAVSGGAVSTIALVAKDQAMDAGLVITNFLVSVVTAFTSGGSATMTLGNAADDDGFLVDTFSAASANAVFNPGSVAGALIWDDTNDHIIPYYLSSTANSIPKLKIATAALTAGKMEVYFTCIRP